MTIHKTAYDTHACNGMVTSKTISALEAARIWGGLRPISDAIWQVEGGNASSNDIPSFAHPMLITVASNHNDSYLAIDVRDYGKYDETEGRFEVRAIRTADLRLLQARAQLNQIWLTKPTSILRDINSLPMAIFASWISESLKSKYNLEFESQFNLNILSAIYYNSLFSDQETMDEGEQNRLAAKISVNLRVQQGDVMDIVRQCPVIGNLTEFCKRAAEIANSVRLADLNPGIMVAILGWTWNGGAGREMVTVALEHPPTWLALLVASFSDRSFKMAGITKIAERAARGDNGRQFTNAIKHVLELEPLRT